jgi:hypothetical protein
LIKTNSPLFIKRFAMTHSLVGARQISSAPSPGGEGWDEGGQLFAPKRHNLIRQKKSVLRPILVYD